MYKIIKSSNVGGYSNFTGSSFFSSLCFPEVTMEVQTQTFVFSEESHHPLALDEVQMCCLRIFPILILSQLEGYSSWSETEIRVREKVELGGDNEKLSDSSISSFNCK